MLITHEEAQRILHHIAHRWVMGCKCGICQRVDRHRPHLVFGVTAETFVAGKLTGAKLQSLHPVDRFDSKPTPAGGMGRTEPAEKKAVAEAMLTR